MKRTISLIFALILCLSLCACGSKQNDQPSATEPSEISFGQKITVGEYSLEITAADFIGRAYVEINGDNHFASSGNSLCVVRATLYNDSRKECRPDIVTFALNYDNGYDIHTGKGEWTYAPNAHYIPDLDPKESLSFLTLIEMPDFQANDAESPITLEVKLAGQSFVMDIDPDQLSLDGAILLFAEEKGQQYFKERMSEYPVLSHDDIIAAFTDKQLNVSIFYQQGLSGGDWYLFAADGKIKQPITEYNTDMVWEVKDNTFIMNGKYVCEVKRVNDTTYLLLKDGVPFMIAY